MRVALGVGLAVASTVIWGRPALPITGLVRVAAAISGLAGIAAAVSGLAAAVSGLAVAISGLAGIAAIWLVTVIARLAVRIALITTIGLTVIALPGAIRAAVIIAA